MVPPLAGELVYGLVWAVTPLALGAVTAVRPWTIAFVGLALAAGSVAAYLGSDTADLDTAALAAIIGGLALYAACAYAGLLVRRRGGHRAAS